METWSSLDPDVQMVYLNRLRCVVIAASVTETYMNASGELKT